MANTAATSTTLPGSVVEQATEVAKTAVPVIQEYARELLTWIRAGKDFVTEQAPDLAKQIIAWGLASSIIWCVIGLTLIGISLLVVFKWILPILKINRDKHIEWRAKNPSHFHSPYGDAYVGHTLLAIACAAPGFVGFVMFWNNVLHTAKIFFAPKVFLIEYLSRLVR